MKHILTVFLALFLVFAFVSCEITVTPSGDTSSTTTDTGSTTTTTTTTTTAPATSEGTVTSPVVLTSTTTPMSSLRTSKVGKSADDARNSYYKFVAPYSSTLCYIQIANVLPSTTDLDYYLYSNSAFSTTVASELSTGTNGTWKPSGITRGNTYYLRVLNYTNTSNVTFDLRIW